MKFLNPQTRFQEIREMAESFLDTRNNLIHMEVSSAFALRLLNSEPGDETVVMPAIILHDVGWKMVPEELQIQAFGPKAKDMETNRIHEVEGARIAREILEKLEYEASLVDEIVEIILGHDSRRNPLSFNDAIVKDADKLWRFSKEAFKIDPERFGIDPLAHMHWLGQQIDGWFVTETGRKVAREEQRLRVVSL
ncbi:MAG: HD domain-containing protein [Deltaproteobacteria bacterium]|nr:HD domain-containing protein [Deltaproteobacteria bacterium]